MWKKTFLASAVTGLLASAAIIIQPTSADSSRSGCREAARRSSRTPQRRARNLGATVRADGRLTRQPIMFANANRSRRPLSLITSMSTVKPSIGGGLQRHREKRH
jgi:hypothetical protein